MNGKTTPTLPREYWDIRQVCAHFGIKRSYIYGSRYDGHAPGSLGRKVGQRLVWDPDELAEWWAVGAPKFWPPDGGGA